MIVALICFLALCTAAVYEIVALTAAFEDMQRLTAQAKTSALLCVEYKTETERQREKDGEESEKIKTDFEAAQQAAKASIENAAAFWNGKRLCAMIFGNHSVVKSADERLATLEMQANTGQWEDAAATAAAMESFFFDLKDDTHLTLGNLF